MRPRTALAVTLAALVLVGMWLASAKVRRSRPNANPDARPVTQSQPNAGTESASGERAPPPVPSADRLIHAAEGAPTARPGRTTTTDTPSGYTVTCTIGGPITDGPVDALLDLPRKEDGTYSFHVGLNAEIRGGRLTLREQKAEGSALIVVPGFNSVRVGWSMDASGNVVCGPVGFEKSGFVYGTVAGLVTNRTWVAGCRTRTQVVNGRYSLEAREGSCTLVAFRCDGQLLVTGSSADIQIMGGERHFVALQVPDVQHGTVGVELETSDDGPVVAGLAMGSPADRAGMRKGDLILAVDGNNVQDLGTDELFGLLAGPLDTPIGIAVWDLEGSFTLHVTPEIMGHEEADRPTCLRL